MYVIRCQQNSINDTCGESENCSWSVYLCVYIISIQVNEKFYKLERVYRDCIKMTRDKTRIYSILHDAPGA